MRIDQLVRMYELGAITAHHLVLEALNLIGPDNADAVMDALPAHLHPEIRAAVERYRPGEMLTNHGPIPSPESVDRARNWLDLNLARP